MFLRYVHSFRAVAIVVIVAGHAVVTLKRDEHPRTIDLLLDLLDNGTVLFVFVAGFLFHHLVRKYEYRDYLTKKLTNVVIPYVLVSIPAVVYTVAFTDLVIRHPAELSGTSVAYQALWLLLNSGATVNYPLWFVPMIALYYLAAPLFVQFIRYPWLYLAIVSLVPVAMLAHRPPEIDSLSVALYFLPAYLIGMWASQYRDRLEPLLRRGWPVLLGAFLLAVLARFLFSERHGNEYASRLFTDEFGLFDWMLPQKLLLCFALLGLLLRFDELIGDRLKLLGDISFTIFFVHGYLLFAFLVVWTRVAGTDPQGSIGLWLALTVGTVTATAAGTALARRVFGRRSRILIGS